MKYRYLRFVKGLGGIYYYKNDGVKKAPREAINEMAAQGYRYVGNVPVKTGYYGSLTEYDMIFEKIAD
ncbi:DUF4177 domain-containing protein [Ruminococcus flavefaciens]|uniref:DUF4177 domain-containing protein n=1 Tax=Ruminococcus flavefaciens 007c TaxID=1341157 RepID=W7UDP9_RUMFL|nr:DUF4177 domain-containing protein [Ruminococcus flavefaciens]EWM53261.1 hypothetical protein RF007C_09825 [Ruminococcus flavefaciens 007c]